MRSVFRKFLLAFLFNLLHGGGSRFGLDVGVAAHNFPIGLGSPLNIAGNIAKKVLLAPLNLLGEPTECQPCARKLATIRSKSSIHFEKDWGGEIQTSSQHKFQQGFHGGLGAKMNTLGEHGLHLSHEKDHGNHFRSYESNIGMQAGHEHNMLLSEGGQEKNFRAFGNNIGIGGFGNQQHHLNGGFHHQNIGHGSAHGINSIGHIGGLDASQIQHKHVNVIHGGGHVPLHQPHGQHNGFIHQAGSLGHNQLSHVQHNGLTHHAGGLSHNHLTHVQHNVHQGGSLGHNNFHGGSGQFGIAGGHNLVHSGVGRQLHSQHNGLAHHSAGLGHNNMHFNHGGSNHFGGLGGFRSMDNELAANQIEGSESFRSDQSLNSMNSGEVNLVGALSSANQIEGSESFRSGQSLNSMNGAEINLGGALSGANHIEGSESFRSGQSLNSMNGAGINLGGALSGANHMEGSESFRSGQSLNSMNSAQLNLAGAQSGSSNFEESNFKSFSGASQGGSSSFNEYGISENGIKTSELGLANGNNHHEKGVEFFLKGKLTGELAIN